MRDEKIAVCIQRASGLSHFRALVKYPGYTGFPKEKPMKMILFPKKFSLTRGSRGGPLHPHKPPKSWGGGAPPKNDALIFLNSTKKAKEAI